MSGTGLRAKPLQHQRPINWVNDKDRKGDHLPPAPAEVALGCVAAQPWGQLPAKPPGVAVDPAACLHKQVVPTGDGERFCRTCRTPLSRKAG
jgi:hypothetical protein